MGPQARLMRRFILGRIAGPRAYVCVSEAGRGCGDRPDHRRDRRSLLTGDL